MKPFGDVEISVDYFNEECSIFETMVSYGGIILFLEEHLTRLFESAKTTGIIIDKSLKELTEDVYAAINNAGLTDAYVRLTISRRSCTVFVKPKPVYPKQWYAQGVSIQTASSRKNLSMSYYPEVKSSNYLNAIVSYAEKKDHFDLLFLGTDSFVKEGTVCNIFAVKKAVIITPPVYGILNGVTRSFVLQLAEQNSIDCRVFEMTRHELYNADEVFLTNSSSEILPIRMIDSRVIANGKPGKTTNMLHKKYRQYINHITRKKGTVHVTR